VADEGARRPSRPRDLDRLAATVPRPADAPVHARRPSSERELDRLLREVARSPGVAEDPAARVFGGTSRFQVLRRLGAGGFGVVYLVRDVAVGADVALKTLPVARPELIYRLKREFRTLADLRHANLVSFYELFAEEDRCFFTMEYVPGRTFLDHVRRDGALDERRLRGALAQLVRGLGALHEAGKLHRDVKPSNVLVSHDERVVILDFGLSTEIEESGLGCSAVMAGTPAYMSPEHAHGEKVSTASDWFSVGVMLYEALTGRLPFHGSRAPLAVPSGAPPSFAGLGQGIPAELVELCRALLDRDAASRPGAAEIMAALGPSAEAAAPAPPAAGDPPLIGRERELAALRDALRAIEGGAGATVLVEGSSGAGKSALVHEFLAGAERMDDVVVLRGRCYERERVPYQGIDSLVDDLCRFLHGRGGAAADALLPRHLPALVRLFPVLGRIPSVAEQCRIARSASADQQELRQRAFGALRELLGRISDRYPLVVHIDDLQWGDLDTAALLHEILRPPDAPSMLLVLSYRSEDRERSPCLRALFEASIGDVARVVVGPLEAAAAEALARRFLPAGERGADPARIACEAGGNPFFILELARFAALRGGGDRGSDGAPDLQRALGARVEQLPDAARRLLEVVAVAGHPIAETVARRAADVSGPPWEAWGVLVAGHLVRFTGAADERSVEPLHDRIRETVASSLAPARVLECHRGLAAALEAAEDADPEVLAWHLEAAGEVGRAYESALVAAAQAEQALAFDRAARLFRWALRLAPQGEARGALLASLGAALAHAGRGVESASAYLEAASHAGEEERTPLRREAALQLLLSGHIDEGSDVAGEALRGAGVAIPRSPRTAFLSLVARTAFTRVRGLRHRERAEAEVPARELTQMDHLWALTRGLAMVDEVRGAEFAARYLLRALAAGEPRRVAQGLAVATGHAAAAAPFSRRTRALLASLDGMDRRLGDPLVHAYAILAQTIQAQSKGQWPGALALADEAERALAERCTGVAWEIWTARAFATSSLFYLGRWQELALRADANLAEARDRGNTYAMVGARAPYGVVAWLVRGDAAGARRQLGEAVASWSSHGFHLQHYWLLMAESFLDLHAGDGAAAWARVSGRWPELKRSLLLRMPFVRTELVHARGASALAAAAGERLASARQALVAEAARSARALDGIGSDLARALAKLIAAGVAAQEGRAEEAAQRLELAALDLERQHMAAHAAAARVRIAELRGAAPPPFLPDEAAADPAASVRMLAPGLGR
jgi:hypothetical protein